MLGYKWVGYDTTTGQQAVQLASGKAYPVNVEVAWDGRILCGRSSALSWEDDVFVYSPEGMALTGFKAEAASAGGHWLDQQDALLVVSGDGLRVTSANSAWTGTIVAGELRFVTIP